MLKSDKMELNTKSIKRERESQIIKKCPHLQKARTILNLNAPNKVASKFIKQNLIKTKMRH